MWADRDYTRVTTVDNLGRMFTTKHLCDQRGDGTVYLEPGGAAERSSSMWLSSSCRLSAATRLSDDIKYIDVTFPAITIRNRLERKPELNGVRWRISR